MGKTRIIAETGAGQHGVADRLLLDAKPPKGATRPGGNAVAFDWTMLDDFDPGLPWMLSGGLDPGNVGEAVRVARPPGLDVSSGVESAPGIKDPALIAAFVAAARAAAGRA
jgi:phosphoribosylanthranilate isomerase